MKYFILIHLPLLILFAGCNQKSINKIEGAKEIENSIKYAKNIEVYEYFEYTQLLIKNQLNNQHQSYFLVDKNKPVPKILNGEKIIKTPINNIVVTSTTHVAMLELLNLQDNLIAFPQTHFISSEKTRERITKGIVKELGNVQQMNTEILLTIKPDVIVSFEITGTNKVLKELERKGYSIIVNNDWLEETPLGRAEWLLLYGYLFNQKMKALQIFNSIENNYNKAKMIAAKAVQKPKVLSGIIFNDVWNMPAGNSFEAALLKDANTHYIWCETDGTGSLLLNVETVIEKGQQADFWINPGIYTSHSDLSQSNKIYTHFKPFTNKQIYSYAHLRGVTGGYKYFETAPTRPDLVLKDLIKIAHPELMRHYDFSFYKKLE
ncbi:MAG: ABC transporter substrate-binding protein [Bacteroidetes bacterium]|nr:ABC transporter substrate-binding protein [Bacteroidota bacterium]